MEKNNTNIKSKIIFRKNLERYIQRSGKQKRDIAFALGVQPSTISDWLAGRGYPRLKSLEVLAEILGVSVSELVEEVNLGQESISAEEQEVLDLFHKVPKEKRELVLSMIRAATDNL